MTSADDAASHAYLLGMDVELREITSDTVRAICELGVTEAKTSVVPSNAGATRLYESLGFRLTGEEDHEELVMALLQPAPMNSEGSPGHTG